jgi:hypothetical protein
VDDRVDLVGLEGGPDDGLVADVADDDLDIADGRAVARSSVSRTTTRSPRSTSRRTVCEPM